MATESLTESLRETLAIFDPAGTPRTTSEVAGDLDLGRRSTYERLDRLVERGRLETKKVGASGRVWWRPPGGAASTGDDADGGGVGEDATAGNGAASPGDGEASTGAGAGSAAPEGVGTDVAGREPTAEALRAERERFRSLVDAVEEYAIFSLDADGRVETWNDGARAIKGYDREEILGRHLSTFYTAADRVAGVPEANLARAAETGSVQDEGWRVRADGTRFWGHVTITARHDDGGTLRGFTKVTRDTTDRRERERAVREERNLLRNVLEAIPTGIAIFDGDGEARRVNRRFADLLGLDDEDAGGYALGDRPVYDESGAEIPYPERPAPRALATGERVDRRVQVDGADDRTRWLSVTAEPLDGSEGVVVATTDVTPLKERARRLERQRDDLEHELEAVFERVDDGFYALDDQFRFTYVNGRAADLLGRSPDELLGEHVRDAFDPAPEVWAAFEEATETQSSVSLETFSGDLGAWFEVRIYPSESGLSVHFSDVSERKEREEQLERYAGILEAIGEPAYELDTEGRFTFVNDAFVEYSGYEESELLGEHVALGMDEAVIEEAESLQAELLADGGTGTASLEYEAVTSEGERRPVENRFSLLTDDAGRFQGTAGMLWDVGDRVERERELERYETVVESIDEGVYVVDDDWRFAWVNGAYAEMLGYAPEELVGEPVSLVVDDDVVGTAREYDAALRAGDPIPDVVEADLQTADGESFPAAASFALLETRDGERRRVGVVRDVTERKQFEEALTALYDSARELFAAGTTAEVAETVVETVTDVLDIPGVAVYRYDEGAGLLRPDAQSVESGFMREELPAVPPDDSSVTGHVYATGESRRFDDVTGSPYLQTDATEMRAGVFAPMGDHGVLVVGSRAVGEFDARTQRLVELLAANAEAAFDRVERERALEESERRYRTLVDNFPNGAVVLFDEDLRYLTVGGQIYDGLAFSADDLEGGRMADRLPGELFEALAPAYRAAFDGEDCEFETAFEGEIRQFRVLPVYDDDGAVFAGMAMTQDVTRRREREAQLERQREQLAALDNVNSVVREITDAVIDQSTREEIERTVCERLAATDSYLCAWTGDVDVAGDEVVPRTGAGLDGRLEGTAIPLDPDGECGDAPTARAARTGEMQTTRTDGETGGASWLDHADASAVRSAAAIPVVHRETVYGVLAVAADRPDAFEGQERDVVGQLGEVVGHAIAATERKRALLSDEVVELEFRIQDVFEGLDAGDADEGTIALDHVVPVEDEAFVVYGTATEEGVAGVEALLDGLPHWTDVAFSGGDGARSDGDGTVAGDGAVDFELRLSEPPVLSRVASMGGSLVDAVYEGGDFRMTVHLAPGADVRRVIDAVEGAYPTAEMVKRRQTERPDDAGRVEDVLETGLTDRQRVALEAAYRGGFFEWPRAVSGEDVADTLGVSPPTFHQHLRKAERKVLGSVLSRSATAT